MENWLQDNVGKNPLKDFVLIGSTNLFERYFTEG